jgi:ribosomal protein L13
MGSRIRVDDSVSRVTHAAETAFLTGKTHDKRYNHHFLFDLIRARPGKSIVKSPSRLLNLLIKTMLPAIIGLHKKDAGLNRR